MPVADVAVAAVSLVLGVLSAIAARGNLTRLGDVRRRAPLEVAEILAAPPPARRAPRRWPEAATLDDARVAAAYRDYAYERRESLALFAEALLLIGGAALGASILDALKGWPHVLTPVASGTVAVFGVMLRRIGEDAFTLHARRYERRRATLLAVAPEPPRQRRRWFRR